MSPPRALLRAAPSAPAPVPPAAEARMDFEDALCGMGMDEPALLPMPPALTRVLLVMLAGAWGGALWILAGLVSA